MQLAVPLPANGDRTDHVRARIIGDGVAPVGPNDSAAMGGLAAADCLIVRLPNAPAAIPGDKVPTLLLD